MTSDSEPAVDLLRRAAEGDAQALGDVFSRHRLRLRIQEVLNGMDPIDREVLALRHFEELSNQETAQVLGIGEVAASHRFVRALRRLKGLLVQGNNVGGGGER